jgi:predicted nucleic acid-binding protein
MLWLTNKIIAVYMVSYRSTRDFDRRLNLSTGVKVMSAVGTYMLDTNVFNRVLDGQISLSSIAGHRLLVTGIQRDELNKTKDDVRRTALLVTFEVISPEMVLASSFAFGIEGAGWGQANWNDGSDNFQRMRTRLRELDPKKKKLLNQERDILIAETAIKIGATLVSDDRNLRQVVSEFGGRTIEPKKLTAACP